MSSRRPSRPSTSGDRAPLCRDGSSLASLSGARRIHAVVGRKSTVAAPVTHQQNAGRTPDGSRTAVNPASGAMTMQTQLATDAGNRGALVVPMSLHGGARRVRRESASSSPATRTRTRSSSPAWPPRPASANGSSIGSRRRAAVVPARKTMRIAGRAVAIPRINPRGATKVAVKSSTFRCDSLGCELVSRRRRERQVKVTGRIFGYYPRRADLRSRGRNSQRARRPRPRGGYVAVELRSCP